MLSIIHSSPYNLSGVAWPLLSSSLDPQMDSKGKPLQLGYDIIVLGPTFGVIVCPPRYSTF